MFFLCVRDFEESNQSSSTLSNSTTRRRRSSSILEDGQGDGGPQGRSSTGGGLARVPNLRVCKHLHAPGWHTQGGKDELTSCRGTVAKTSSETQRRKSWAARKGKWSPRGTGTAVLTYPCPGQPCFGGSKVCARVTGKAW